MATDPVCRMTVSEERAKDTFEYKGVVYYFCAPGCRQRFEKDPEKYIGDGPADWVKG